MSGFGFGLRCFPSQTQGLAVYGSEFWVKFNNTCGLCQDGDYSQDTPLSSYSFSECLPQSGFIRKNETNAHTGVHVIFIF